MNPQETGRNEAGTSERAVARMVAVGDLLLPSDPTGRSSQRDPEVIFAGVQPLLSEYDIVFGNLECTLPGDEGVIRAEPRVVSTPQLLRGVKAAGFNIVALANNHAFDCYRDGFHRLRRFLDEMGIAYFGAGDNLVEAAAPAIMEANGIRVGFVGAVDERCGARRFAGPQQWGIAPLDEERMVSQIRRLRDEVDHVVVSVHWGEERFLVPSPVQVAQAHAWVEAGASLVLGHHPHVIQGMETYRGAPIIYSLGNFVASEVGFTSGDAVKWNRTGRTGCLLLADLTPTSVENVRQVATYDNGLQIEIDGTGFGDKRMARANRAIARGVGVRRYRREHLWVKTVRPAFSYLRWSKLRTLRLRQIWNAIASILRARKAE